MYTFKQLLTHVKKGDIVNHPDFPQHRKFEVLTAKYDHIGIWCRQTQQTAVFYDWKFEKEDRCVWTCVTPPKLSGWDKYKQVCEDTHGVPFEIMVGQLFGLCGLIGTIMFFHWLFS